MHRRAGPSTVHGLLQLLGRGPCSGLRVGALLSLGLHLLLEASQVIPLPPQVILQPTPGLRMRNPDALGLGVLSGASLTHSLVPQVLQCRWSMQMGRLHGRMLLRSASRRPSCVTVPDRQPASGATLFVNPPFDLQGGHLNCSRQRHQQQDDLQSLHAYLAAMAGVTASRQCNVQWA